MKAGAGSNPPLLPLSEMHPNGRGCFDGSRNCQLCGRMPNGERWAGTG